MNVKPKKKVHEFAQTNEQTVISIYPPEILGSGRKWYKTVKNLSKYTEHFKSYRPSPWNFGKTFVFWDFCDTSKFYSLA